MERLKDMMYCDQTNISDEVPIDIKDEPPAIKHDYSTNSVAQVAYNTSDNSTSDKTEFVIKSEDNYNSHNRDRTDTSNTDVDAHFEPLHTDMALKPEPFDTDVDVQSEPLDSDVNVQSEPLHADIALKPEPLDSDVDVQSEPLDTDDVQSEPLDSDVNVQSEPLHTDMALKPEPLDSDVDVQSEPLDSDVNVQSEPLHADMVLKPEPLDSDVDVQSEPLDSDVNVQSEPFHTDMALKPEPLDSDVDVQSEPLDTDVDVQSEPIATDTETPLENDLFAILQSNSKSKTSANTNPAPNNGNNSDHENVLDEYESSTKNTNERQLFKRKREKHVHIEEKPFECNICRERFLLSSDLDRHVHIFNHEELHGSEISCVDKGHPTVKRESRNNRSPTRNNEQQDLSSNVPPPQRICIVCCKRVATAQELIAHRNTHNEDISVSCILCNKTFDHQRLLYCHFRRHLLKHNSDRELLECDVFLARFRKSDVQDSHVLLASLDDVDVQRLRDQRIESCISGVQFATTSERRPLTLSYTDKSFECDICHRVFFLGRNLDRHILNHPQPDALNIDMADNSNPPFIDVVVKSDEPVALDERQTVATLENYDSFPVLEQTPKSCPVPIQKLP